MNHKALAALLRSHQIRATGRTQAAIEMANRTNSILICFNQASMHIIKKKSPETRVMTQDRAFNNSGLAGLDDSVVLDHSVIESAYLDLYEENKFLKGRIEQYERAHKEHSE